MEKDCKRLERIKEFKKKFAETQVTTTHMLKTFTKVPYVHDKYDNHGHKIEGTDQLVERQSKDVFRRGIMSFDDVNYEMYNKYIFSLNPEYNGFHEEINSLIGDDNNHGQTNLDATKPIPLTEK